MRGVWVVEVKITVLQCWVPVSALGTHLSLSDAKFVSRALSIASRRVRVRDLAGGGVVTIREADSGWFWGFLSLSVIIFLLMGAV